MTRWAAQLGIVIPGYAALVSAAAALVIVFLAAIAPMASRVPPASALAGAASTIFGIVSIALPATAMCLLRGRSPRVVLMLLLIVWVCDSSAYYFGRMFGRRPLAPMVSPKKTWEGSIGDLVGATLFGAAAGTWWFPAKSRLRKRSTSAKPSRWSNCRKARW